MAVRSPLKYDSGNLKEMSSAEVDQIVDQIVYQYSLNPGVAFNSGYTLTTDNAWNNTSTKKRSYFGPVDITKLKFQIIDSFGRVINLNNMDCSFALNLICLYDY